MQRKGQDSVADLQQNLLVYTCCLSHWHRHLVLTLSIRSMYSIMNAHPLDYKAEKNGASRKRDINLFQDKQPSSR